ncbi:MAG: hypothetical protein D6722_13875 [Bacteroidetes bacterium]|nr:MAG: hypothetical protein D6722_13875 [Bacteroidota bacterium]
MNHHARHVQTYRDQHRGQWDDSAAHELNSRYLEPHQEDDARMRAQLDEQLAALKSLDAEIDQVNRLGERIRQLAAAIMAELDHSRADLDQASQTLDYFHWQTGDMKRLMDQARAEITQANAH